MTNTKTNCTGCGRAFGTLDQQGCPIENAGGILNSCRQCCKAYYDDSWMDELPCGQE